MDMMILYQAIFFLVFALACYASNATFEKKTEGASLLTDCKELDSSNAAQKKLGENSVRSVKITASFELTVKDMMDGSEYPIFKGHNDADEGSFLYALHGLHRQEHAMALHQHLCQFIDLIEGKANEFTACEYGSDAHMTKYITSSMKTIRTLLYITSRLDNTAGFHLESIIFQDISRCIDSLANLIGTFMHSIGAVGTVIKITADATVYFSWLSTLLSNPQLTVKESSHFILVDFIFEVLGRHAFEETLDGYLNELSPDWCLSLPVFFMRNALPPAKATEVVSKWFNSVFPDDFEYSLIDTTYLVELGHVLHHGFVSLKSFTTYFERFISFGGFNAVEFDEKLLRFLSLVSSAPVFRPSNRGWATRFSDTSSCSNYFSVSSSDPKCDTKKIEALENIWSQTLANTSFENITETNFQKLSTIIYTVDLSYHGLGAKLWEHFPRESCEFDTFPSFTVQFIDKMKVISGYTDVDLKFGLIVKLFDASALNDSKMFDRRILLEMINFLTDIISDHYESDFRVEIPENAQKLISFCVLAIDGLLDEYNFEFQTVAYWTDVLGYMSSRLFSLFLDLSSDLRFSEQTSKCQNTLTVLLSLGFYNEHHAELTMNMLIKKASESPSNPPLSCNIHTPGRLKQANLDDSMFQFYTTILNFLPVNGQIPDCFFSGIKSQLQRDEISFKTALSILAAVSISELKVDVNGSGFLEFPQAFLVNSEDDTVKSEMGETFKELFIVYLHILNKNVIGNGDWNYVQLKAIADAFNVLPLVCGALNESATQVEDITMGLLSENFNEFVSRSMMIFMKLLNQGLRPEDAKSTFAFIETFILSKEFIILPDWGDFKILYLCIDLMSMALLRSAAFTIDDQSNESTFVCELLDFAITNDFDGAISVMSLSRVVRNSKTQYDLLSHALDQKIVSYDVSIFDVPAPLKLVPKSKFFKAYLENISKADALTAVSLISPIPEWISRGHLGIHLVKKYFPELFSRTDVMLASPKALGLLLAVLDKNEFIDSDKLELLDHFFSNEFLIQTLVNDRRTIQSVLFAFIMSLSHPVVDRFLAKNTRSSWYLYLNAQIKWLNSYTAGMNLATKKFKPKYNIEYLAWRFTEYFFTFSKRDGNAFMRSQTLLFTLDYLDELSFECNTIKYRETRINSPNQELAYFTLAYLESSLRETSKLAVEGVAFDQVLDKLITGIFRLMDDVKLQTSFILAITVHVKKLSSRRFLLKSMLDAVRVDGFIMNFKLFEFIARWMKVDTSLGDIDDYFLAYSETIFNTSAAKINATEKFEPVRFLTKHFSKYFSVTILLANTLTVSPSIHKSVLRQILDFQDPEVLDKCTELETYLSMVVGVCDDQETFSLLVKAIDRNVQVLLTKENVEYWFENWKKIARILPAFAAQAPHLKVIANMGNPNSDSWDNISSEFVENIPAPILLDIVIDFCDDVQDYPDMLRFLPKHLKPEHFNNHTSLKAMGSMFTSIVQSGKRKDVDFKMQPESYGKLLGVLQYALTYNLSIDWNWSYLINLMFTHSGEDLQILQGFAQVLVEALTVDYPDLLKRSTNRNSILTFSFALSDFIDSGSEEMSDVIRPLNDLVVSIYDKLTRTSTANADEEGLQELFDLDSTFHDFCQTPITSIDGLDAWKELLDDANEQLRKLGSVRHDSVALIYVKYIASFLVLATDSSEFIETVAKEFGPVLGSAVAALYASLLGNELSLVNGFNCSALSAFVDLTSVYLTENIDSYWYIVSFLQKIEPHSVTANLLETIRQERIRYDYCLIPVDIVQVLTRSSDEEDNYSEWIDLYVNNIPANAKNQIDLGHLLNIFALIKLESLDDIDINEILRQISRKVFMNGRQKKCYPRLIEMIGSLFTSVTVESASNATEILDGAFSNDVVLVLLREEPSVVEQFLNLLKTVGSKFKDEYTDWLESLPKNANTALKQKFDAQVNERKLSIFSNLATKFIEDIAIVDVQSVDAVSSLTDRIGLLDVKMVKSDTLKTLAEGTVLLYQKLDSSIAQLFAVKEKLLAFFVKAYFAISETVLEVAKTINLVEVLPELSSKCKKASEYEELLEFFKDRLNSSDLLGMHPQASRLQVRVSKEYLKAVSIRSDPLETLNLLKKQKHLSFAEKLEILACYEGLATHGRLSKILEYLSGNVKQDASGVESNNILIVLFFFRSSMMAKSYLSGKSIRTPWIQTFSRLKISDENIDAVLNELASFCPLGKLMARAIFYRSFSQNSFFYDMEDDTAEIGVSFTEFLDFLHIWISEGPFLNQHAVERYVKGSQMLSNSLSLFEEATIIAKVAEIAKSLLCSLSTLYADGSNRLAVNLTHENIASVVRISRLVASSRKQMVTLIKGMVFPPRNIENLEAALRGLTCENYGKCDLHSIQDLRKSLTKKAKGQDEVDAVSLIDEFIERYSDDS